MEELLDVVICDPLEFDGRYFNCWLNGIKPEDAVSTIIRDIYHSNDKNGYDLTSCYQSGVFELLKLEIMDYYRSYEILDHYICRPSLLSSQMIIQIPDTTIRWIIEKYYCLDDRAVREMLGKRFSKNRKDLDEIAESFHLPIASVTRQYENIKRIYSAIEESRQFQCNILNFVETHFALPLPLARKYTCVLFLMACRFSATSKKRFQTISCLQLECCAAVTMACLIPEVSAFLLHWTGPTSTEDMDPGDSIGVNGHSEWAAAAPESSGATSSSPWPGIWRLVGEVDAIEPDKQLLGVLREVMSLVKGEVLERAVQSVRKGLHSSQKRSAIVSKMGSNGRIKVVLKTLVSIGGHLSQSREYRDLFEDIAHKIGEPLEEARLTREESNVFLIHCSTIITGTKDLIMRRLGAGRESTGSGGGSAFSRATTERKISVMDNEWLRFVTCCRFCLWNLY
mmetsp:Transcript_14905/g.22423  ORF Transcript_14905/g.22423 Transcript_14905/m.22423 type:complete len:453 (+) Transcript_14905:20-1378(+)